MDLNKVKELASKVMGIGKNKVKILNPEEAREVMTREDVRTKIEQGVISKKREKGISRGRKRSKKSRKKTGKRKGGKKSRENPKETWMKNVRAQRKKLREIKPELKQRAYRKLYRKIKGGQFKSKKRLMAHINENNYMKSD